MYELPSWLCTYIIFKMTMYFFLLMNWLLQINHDISFMYMYIYMTNRITVCNCKPWWCLFQIDHDIHNWPMESDTVRHCYRGNAVQLLPDRLLLQVWQSEWANGTDSRPFTYGKLLQIYHFAMLGTKNSRVITSLLR